MNPTKWVVTAFEEKELLPPYQKKKVPMHFDDLYLSRNVINFDEEDDQIQVFQFWY
jgi:hypothetical protein